MLPFGALAVVDDLRPADWLIESISSFAENVGSLVPPTYGAYARVFHPAYHGGELVSWAQIARANGKIAHPQMQFARLIGYGSRYSSEYTASQPGVFDEPPAVGTLPADAAASLARTLNGHTAAADRCWFAVWNGWGNVDLDRAFRDRPAFQLPKRNYYLAHGPLAAVSQSVGVLAAHNVSCNLWWPDDHAWCVATEIDLDSTYVGASEACIEELLANSELEVARLDLSAGVTADSDTLNLAVAPDLPKGEQ